MISMTPVIARGFTHWDRSLFPTDEFEERVRVVQARMRADDVVAVLVLSNTYHCSGDLAYLAGWPVGGALLVLPDGEPRMFTFGGGREIFFQKAQLWLAHMQSLGGRFGSALRGELDGLGSGRIGIVGLDQLPSATHEQVLVALAGRDTMDYGAALRNLRTVKRPRERLTIAAAAGLAAEAGNAARQSFERTGDPAASLVEAERVARLGGALDWRGLANIDDTGLQPFESDATPTRRDRLLFWNAVNLHGYWADMALDTGDAGVAHRGVAAMITAAVPGARAATVAEAGLACLPDGLREQALSYGLGGGIGQDLDEEPCIAPTSRATLSAGMILSLRVVAPGHAGGSLAAGLVLVGDSGSTLLAG